MESRDMRWMLGKIGILRENTKQRSAKNRIAPQMVSGTISKVDARQGPGNAGDVEPAPNNLAAQGLPVETGFHLPVALWFIGALILRLALAYGIMQNRRRTIAEKRTTDQAPKNLYAEEEKRDRVRTGAD
jgi:hypothetical protein